MCLPGPIVDDQGMKKLIAATGVFAAAMGASFGILAGPAAAGAPCPPSVCTIIDTPIVRDTGIRDLLDWAWDLGMDCAGPVRLVVDPRRVDVGSDSGGTGSTGQPGANPGDLGVKVGYIVDDARSLGGGTSLGGSASDASKGLTAGSSCPV